jgi:ribosomal protein S1
MTTEPTNVDNPQPSGDEQKPELLSADQPNIDTAPAEPVASVTESVTTETADAPAPIVEEPVLVEVPAPIEEPAPVEVPAPVEDTPVPDEATATPIDETPAPEPVIVATESAPVEAVSATPATTDVPEAPPAGEDADAEKKKSRKRARLTDEESQPIWEELAGLHNSADIIHVECARTIPGGAIIYYKGLEGFIPRSQFMAEGRAEQSDMEPFLGQEIEAVVIEITEGDKKKFVCSRRKALKRDKFKAIKKGDIMEGVVTSVTNYGAFVDLGGIDGLVHVTRLSKVRVKSPSDVLKVKDVVKVRVVEVDPKNERIALSMKEFTESPWTQISEKYPIGSVQKGKIRNITDFGVYLQLEPGIVGMVHISDLSWTRRLQHPSELVRVGQELQVKVLEVKPDDKRIALSLKDTQPDPWPKLANIYPIGTEATGTVKRVMDAGAIVSLEYDIDCFVPRGKMGARRRPRKGAPQTAAATDLNVGDSVRVNVIEMDSDKHSFICGFVRDSADADHGDSRESGFSSRHSASERAFTLGEIAGLHKLVLDGDSAVAIEASADIEEAPKADVVIDQPIAVAEEPVTEAAASVEPPVIEPPAVETETTAIPDEPIPDVPAASDEEPPAAEGEQPDSPPTLG